MCMNCGTYLFTFGYSENAFNLGVVDVYVKMSIGKKVLSLFLIF